MWRFTTLVTQIHRTEIIVRRVIQSKRFIIDQSESHDDFVSLTDWMSAFMWLLKYLLGFSHLTFLS